MFGCQENWGKEKGNGVLSYGFFDVLRFENGRAWPSQFGSAW